MRKKLTLMFVALMTMLVTTQAYPVPQNWTELETPSFFRGGKTNSTYHSIIMGKTLPDGTLMKMSKASVSHRAVAYNNDMITKIPASAEVKYYNRSGKYHNDNDNYAETDQSGIAAIAFDGNDVYIKDPIAGYANGVWVKGTLTGNTISVPLKQFLMYNSTYEYGLYIALADISGTTRTNDTSAESITYTIQADGSIQQNSTSATRTFTVAWSDDDTVYSWGSPGGEYETVFTPNDSYVPTSTELVELPVGVEPETWYAEGLAYSGDIYNEAKVAIVGNKVYISGIFADYPNSWIVGTIDGTKVTFSKLQYLGDYGTYHIWATGATEAGLSDLTMTYDATAGSFTMDEGQDFLANASDTQIYYLDYIVSLTITKNPPMPPHVDALPYENGFGDAESLDNFKIYNVNGDYTSWTYNNEMVRIGYATPNDDWLVSPQFKLEAGHYYAFSIDAKAQSASYPEQFEVKMTKDATTLPNNAVALLSAGTELIPSTTVDHTGLLSYSSDVFTVEESGYYNIGIHNISDDAWYFYVDNFLLEEKLPEDITISTTELTAAGNDIYTALATASKGKLVKDITIDLTKDTEYTISNSIVAPASFTLNGNGAKIDASALEAVMISGDTTAPSEWEEAKVDIKGITVKGLKKALFYSAAKNTLYKEFTIDKCVIEVAGDATTFDFTKGSVAINFTVTNSTFYAPTATTKQFYSSQSGQKATEAGNYTQTLTFKNNTMYNLAKSKNFFSHRQSNQKWLAYDVQNNIFVNCGKSGQVIKGMNGGSQGSNPTWTIIGNIFNYDGADTSAAEETGDAAEPVKDSVAGVVKFTDATSGDFNGFFELSIDANMPASIPGDSRWKLIKQIYSIGESGPWDLTNMTLINYNQETKAFEFTLDVKGVAFFAISDVKAMAAGNDWDGFVAHRYAIAAGDNDATLDTETQLVNANGAVVINGWGKYKVSITEDKKMTVTFVEPYPLFLIGDIAANKWSLKGMSEMTFNTETQSYEYIVKITDAPVYFAISGIASMEDENDWAGFKANYRYAIGDGGNEAVVGESYKLEKSYADDDNTIYLSNNGLYTISVDKTFKLSVIKHEPVDIVVTPEAGDLATAIAAAEENKLAKSLTLNLKADAAYTLSAPIVTSTDIIINGNGATIDASNVDGALITIQAPAAAAPALNRAPAETREGYTYIDNIIIKDATVNGLKGNIVYDNENQTLVEKMTIDNVIFGLATDNNVLKNDALISIAKGNGCIKDFTIQNSTVYNTSSTGAGFFLRTGNNGTIDRAGYDKNTEKQSWTYKNNTFYNAIKSNGKWGNGKNGQNFFKYVVENNIWYNSSKDVAARLMNGRAGAGAELTFKNNTYFYESVDATQYQTNADKSGTILPTDPEFADAANGNFTIGTGTAQALFKTGDPRWNSTVAYDATKKPLLAKEITLAPATGADLSALVNAELGAWEKEGQTGTYFAGIDNLTINLNQAGTYTVSEPIVIGKNFAMTGVGAGGDKGDWDATIIDASALKGKVGLFKITEKPSVAKNDNDVYEFDNIAITGVKIIGLETYLINGQNGVKTLYKNITLDNSVVAIDGSKKMAVFFFQGKSGQRSAGVEQLTVSNSTLYAFPALEQAGGLFDNQSGSGAIQDLKGTKQVLTLQNTTLYNISKGKNTCSQGRNNQNGAAFEIINSIIVNCGKDKQFLKGLGGGGWRSNVVYTVDNSSFTYGASESSKGTDAAADEVVGAPAKATFTNIVYGEPFFRKDITQGIFTLGICPQIGKKVGDPRWYNIPMITNLQNALARAAELLDGAQEDWTSAPAINEAVENLAAAYNDNKEYLESNYQEAIDEATARVEAAIAEFNKSMGDVTAIESVNAAKIDNAAWYTINGQRVDKPTQKGLYIHNGRKVVIK